jgi:hypothetical protein
MIGMRKSGTKEGFSFGHSALGAGVAVTIIRTSNVGVKVGIVGSGVIVGGVGVKVSGIWVGGVALGASVAVFVSSGNTARDGIAVSVGILPFVSAHAESKRQKQTNNNVFRAISSLHKKK